jgi:hypothetical protein
LGEDHRQVRLDRGDAAAVRRDHVVAADIDRDERDLAPMRLKKRRRLCEL